MNLLPEIIAEETKIQKQHNQEAKINQLRGKIGGRF